MRVLSNLAVKKLCFCSLLFPSAGRKWNIAGTNVRSEPLSFVKSAGGASGTRALVPGALIENDMAKTVCLHDYQKDIMRRLSEEWLTHRSVMVQMPTGTGKTHVLAAVVSSFLTDGKRTVWIVAHRRELVAQIEETVAKYGTSLTDGCIRVMSIQWLTRHYDDVVEKPELVIIDEAHHAQARTYRILWSRCPEAKFLGLTATPCRMGRSGFTDLFDSLVCSWSVAEPHTPERSGITVRCLCGDSVHHSSPLSDNHRRHRVFPASLLTVAPCYLHVSRHNQMTTAILSL